jgi:hypothetical protein
MTGGSEMHLDYDEVQAVLRMQKIPDDRIQHLVGCMGCRNTIDWEQMAANGRLWSDEVDWPSRTFAALGMGCRRRGNGMIYAIPALGIVSKLSMLPFFSSMRIRIGPLKG